MNILQQGIFDGKCEYHDEVPNGTPKALIPFDGVVNQDKVLKSNAKPKGDYVTHFKGWIEKLVARSVV